MGCVGVGALEAGFDGFDEAFVATAFGLIAGGPAASVGEAGVGAVIEKPESLFDAAPADHLIEDGFIAVACLVDVGSGVEAEGGEMEMVLPEGGDEGVGGVGAAGEQQLE